MVHNVPVLLSIYAQHWEVKEGKYSYTDLDLYPDNEKFYQVSYNPLCFGYSALWDNDLLFDGRLTTEVLVGLIKHLANIFVSMFQWQQGKRGRKLGIEADLTQGGIAHNQDSKLTLGIKYYRRYSADSFDLTGSDLELFIIKFSGRIEGRMPSEHAVMIDASGNAQLGYCASVINDPACNDMHDIFQSVFKQSIQEVDNV